MTEVKCCGQMNLLSSYGGQREGSGCGDGRVKDLQRSVLYPP